MDTYVQGGSIDRRVFLNDDGTAIDTASFITVEVIARHKYFGSDAGTYSLANGKLAKESPTTAGYVFFDIPPATTTSLPPGVYELQVVTTETDADYDDSIRTRKFKDESFKIIKKKT